MRSPGYYLSRLFRRTPDPDVVHARKVLDETRRTSARVERVLIDIDAQGWTTRDRPLDMATMVQDARRPHD